MLTALMRHVRIAHIRECFIRQLIVIRRCFYRKTSIFAPVLTGRSPAGGQSEGCDWSRIGIEPRDQRVLTHHVSAPDLNVQLVPGNQHTYGDTALKLYIRFRSEPCRPG